jgi:membrane protease YdiL (CAAX protease family)
MLALWAGAHVTGAVRLPVALDMRPGSVLAGFAVAGFLLVPGLLLRAAGMPGASGHQPPGFYLPFVPALAWVAAAEELMLRGLLQPLLRTRIGPGAAIAVVAVMFAGMHLPAYGWGAMPLDLGVGLVLGWLREEMRSVTACVVGHVAADLGGWFLA